MTELNNYLAHVLRLPPGLPETATSDLIDRISTHQRLEASFE